MMTPFESAVRGSLEGSHGGRVLVRDDHGATALHHYRGLNFSLYRVSNFTSDSAKIFTLDGAIDDTCELTPTEYLAQARAPLAAAPTP